MFHNTQAGVARIFEIPSGAKSHPATSADKANAIATRVALLAGVPLFAVGCRPKKICDVTTPAMTRHTMAPLLKGHTYHSKLRGKTMTLAAVATQSVRESTTHRGAAQCQ